ncbi:MAG: LacI family transcriptional regulator [Chloroflexi bacterium]|nr:LacI family transcriptional regulator [Chloroflexota bacterium]
MAQRRPTSKDVAELAGVSRTTVSFVLNNVPGMRISQRTRQRVQKAALRLNYHPDATARRMVSGRTHVIGFVLRQSADQTFADFFLPQVLNGLFRGAAAQDYHVLFEPVAPDDKTGAYAALLHERHVDGIVLSGPRTDDLELERMYAEGAPVLLMGQLPQSRIPFVDVDNVGGAELATRHLLNLGHRRVALITNAPLAYTGSADRMKGYRRALAKAAIRFDPALVRYGNFTPQSGYVAMQALLEVRPRPTAVFAASDTVAFGALHAIRECGFRIPQEMAVVGFDDVPLAEFVDPPLTTLRLPAFQIGENAANALIGLIAKERANHPQMLLKTELIIRESCGAHLR